MDSFVLFSMYPSCSHFALKLEVYICKKTFLGTVLYQSQSEPIGTCIIIYMTEWQTIDHKVVIMLLRILNISHEAEAHRNNVAYPYGHNFSKGLAFLFFFFFFDIF